MRNRSTRCRDGHGQRNQSRFKVCKGQKTSTNKVIGKDDEFKGAYYEIREVEFEDKNGSKEKRECEINYNIWYKLAE